MDDLLEGALRVGWLLLRVLTGVLWQLLLQMWLWGVLPDTRIGRAARTVGRCLVIVGLAVLLVLGGLSTWTILAT